MRSLLERITFSGRVLGWFGGLLAAGALLAQPSPSTEADSSWCAAMDLYQDARYAEARVALRRLEGGAPEVESDFHLGRLALWFDDQAEAVLRLERAVTRSPNEARLQNAWGDACGMSAQRAAVWQKLGWARRCLAAYQRAVELEPNNPKWRWSLIGFSCVAPRIVGGGYERARAQIAELSRLDALEGAFAAATVMLAERRPAEAFICLEAVVREHPDNASVWYQIGRCAAMSGQQVARGVAALRRCLELGPVGGDGQPSLATAHFRLSELLELAGDLPGAQRERALALQLQPDLRIDKVALRL